MWKVHLLLLFFAVSVQTVISSSSYEPPKEFVPCGLYGFRCIDKTRAEICRDKEEEECSARPMIFQCADGLVCDEEKKEYCAPDETSKTNRTRSAKRAANSFGVVRVLKRIKDDYFDDMDQEAATVKTETTTDDDDDEEQATEPGEVDPWNGNPPILCTSHGFFPGLSFKLICVIAV